jgi:xylulokinase
MRDVPSLTQITGNLAMPGFTAPKLQWLREHEPEVFARAARVLLPKDYLRLRLTGKAVADCSDASGTLWLDARTRQWSDILLSACGLTREQMPKLVEGSEISARLLPDISKRWGLRADLPVAGGGGDNAASAVGMGCVSPGDGFISLGTSGVVFVCTHQFRPNPAQAMHAFCHALPDRWHQMSVMLSAASAVSWGARHLGFTDEASLLAAAASLSHTQREQAPLFLPYLSGERTPHNHPQAQGVLFGLTHASDVAAMAYAIVEGVSFGLLDGYRTLTLPGDTTIKSLSVVGGGARNPYWIQLLSTMLNIPLHTHQGAEAGAALGAARLAWLADGGDPAHVLLKPAIATHCEPKLNEQSLLTQRYERFRKLYQSLRSSFPS